MTPDVEHLSLHLAQFPSSSSGVSGLTDIYQRGERGVGVVCPDWCVRVSCVSSRGLQKTPARRRYYSDCNIEMTRAPGKIIG